MCQKMMNWRIYLADVLLENYRDVENALDSEPFIGSDNQTGEADFKWVDSHTRTGDSHSNEDNAYLRVMFPKHLCKRSEDVEAFAREAFNRGVARIRK